LIEKKKLNNTKKNTSVLTVLGKGRNKSNRKIYNYFIKTKKNYYIFLLHKY